MIELLKNLGIFVGNAAIGIGCLAIFFPKKMSNNFGIQADGIQLGYVGALGIRDVFIGLIVLLLWWKELWFELGICYFCLALVAACDGILVYKMGDKTKAFIHAGGFIICCLLGVSMIV